MPRPIRKDIRRSWLISALEQSVSIQSHYAKQLNTYDGGQRMIFADATEWIERLEALIRAKRPKGDAHAHS